MRSIIALVLLALCSEAHAQCPPGAQVYINPRLVPIPPRISREQLRRILINPTMPQKEKQMYNQHYMDQNQPIEMPYRNGIVVINPANPCIQQYLGKIEEGEI